MTADAMSATRKIGSFAPPTRKISCDGALAVSEAAHAPPQYALPLPIRSEPALRVSAMSWHSVELAFCADAAGASIGRTAAPVPPWCSYEPDAAARFKKSRCAKTNI
jgi:hypothetical protein